MGGRAVDLRDSPTMSGRGGETFSRAWIEPRRPEAAPGSWKKITTSSRRGGRDGHVAGGWSAGGFELDRVEDLLELRLIDGQPISDSAHTLMAALGSKTLATGVVNGLRAGLHPIGASMRVRPTRRPPTTTG